MTLRIVTGDCRAVLASLPADSVHCCVTSPPYWGLRDYGVAGQLGLEPTFTEFIDKMVDVFREVRRVLRPDGTLWLNLGDSYTTGGFTRQGKPRNVPQLPNDWAGTELGGRGRAAHANPEQRDFAALGLKAKDLCGIPWRVAFALQADGWWLRQDIIWSKPNPMPESVTDRCTKAHEYLFLLTKSARYFYDAEAIKEPGEMKPQNRFTDGRGQKESGWATASGYPGHRRPPGMTESATRNKRSVWEIDEDEFAQFQQWKAQQKLKTDVWSVATAPFKQAHFATFPPALIEPCIKAGTSEKGCCGKCGAPWERLVERGEIPMTERRKNLAATQRQGHPDYVEVVRPSSLGAGSGGDVPGRSVQTLGWHPTCTCQAAVIPCTVLDPFGGAGTTGLVADRLQRNAILIELNPTYAGMARKRIFEDAPLFAEAAE